MNRVTKKALWWIAGSLGISGILTMVAILLSSIVLMAMVLASSESSYKGQPLRATETLDIPLPLLSVFLGAQNSHVSWERLAAISKVTTDFGKKGSTDQRIGIMGVPLSLWSWIQVDGNADGLIDADNPADAIVSSANLFSLYANSGEDAVTQFQLTEEQRANMTALESKFRSALLLHDGWLWPLLGNTSISSYFGLRSDPLTGERSFHDGIDLPAPNGTPLLAVRSGTVVQIASDDGGYGNMVVIEHGDGWKSLYGHLSLIGVEVGQVVDRGEVIGTVGSTGKSTGPHLHLGIMENGSFIDPLGLWHRSRSSSMERSTTHGNHQTITVS